MTNVLSKLYNDALLLDWSLPYNCYELGHTWDPECHRVALFMAGTVLKKALLMYSGLYFANQLIIRRRLDKKSTLNTLKNIIHSSAFLSAVPFFGFTFGCIGVSIFKNVPFLGFPLLSFVVNSMALALEQPSRRTTIAFYCANIASECLYRILMAKGYVKSIPKGEVLLFAFGISSILSASAATGPSKDLESYLLKFLTGHPREQIQTTRDENANNLTELIKMHGDTLRDALKVFAFGTLSHLGLKSALKVPRILKSPHEFLSILIDSSHIRCGGFLASFLVGFRYLHRTLQSTRVADNKRKETVKTAALVASLAMLIYPSPFIARYVFWKSMENYYNEAIKKHNIRGREAISTAIYSLSLSIIFCAVLFEPWSVKKSYVKFLNRMSDGKLEQFNTGILQMIGKMTNVAYDHPVHQLIPEYCSSKYLESVFVWTL